MRRQLKKKRKKEVKTAVGKHPCGMFYENDTVFITNKIARYTECCHSMLILAKCGFYASNVVGIRNVMGERRPSGGP